MKNRLLLLLDHIHCHLVLWSKIYFTFNLKIINHTYNGALVAMWIERWACDQTTSRSSRLDGKKRNLEWWPEKGAEKAQTRGSQHHLLAQLWCQLCTWAHGHFGLEPRPYFPFSHSGDLTWLPTAPYLLCGCVHGWIKSRGLFTCFLDNKVIIHNSIWVFQIKCVSLGYVKVGYSGMDS